MERWLRCHLIRKRQEFNQSGLESLNKRFKGADSAVEEELAVSVSASAELLRCWYQMKTVGLVSKEDFRKLREEATPPEE